MRYLVLTLTILLLGGTTTSSGQSLAELAKKEKQRRQKGEQENSESYDEWNLQRVHFGWKANPEKNPEEAAPAESLEPQEAISTVESDFAEETQAPKSKESGAMALASFSGDSQENKEDVEFIRAGGGNPQSSSGTGGIASTGGAPQFRMPDRAGTGDFHMRGAIYADWFKSTYADGLSTSQLSNRVKLELGRRPGDGWRFFVDARDRFRTGSKSNNLLLIYDARVIYENVAKPVELSVGQMNLYNSAGAGQLLGGVFGYKFRPTFTVGGYAGLEPDIYGFNVDSRYQKWGVFTQLRGSGAKSAALSYNSIRFNGMMEREFIYGSGLLPLSDFAVLYGNLEYELGDYLTKQDRLSRLFLNARYDPTEALQFSAYYSSGKGLDFHRFLLTQSQDPNPDSAELERFYYSESFGVRMTVKPHRRFRLYVSQRESKQIDRLIHNHTTQLGASAWNIAGTGVSLYGSYNINRGDMSESDSYRVTLSRDFGRLSWTAYYSSTFNGIRFDAATGLPRIVHITDRNTISNDLFFSITDALAASLVYDYSSLGDQEENTMFFRAIYRFR